VLRHVDSSGSGDKDEWSASRHGLFTPGEEGSVAHQIVDLVDPVAGLDDVKKNDTSCSCRESKPGRPTCSPGAIWTVGSGQCGKTRDIISKH
jgi:hypothetical protein